MPPSTSTVISLAQQVEAHSIRSMLLRRDICRPLKSVADASAPATVSAVSGSSTRAGGLISSCSWCERESGIRLTGNVTHGICARHLDMEKAKLSIRQKLVRFNQLKAVGAI